MDTRIVNTSNDVWVIVETHKNIGQLFSYRGVLSREELEAWSAGTLKGALTLRRVYWIDEDLESGRRTPIVVGRHEAFRNGNGPFI